MSRNNQDRRRNESTDPRKRLLEQENGYYLKKWTGRLPVALLYPNHYQVGMSSLGFQLVYRLLNENEGIVCERLFLPDPGRKIVSLESGRRPEDFTIIFCSISFEHDFVNLAAFLLAAGLEPLACNRPKRIAPGTPLVVCGGVAAFMNPEPLAPFVDLFVIGEAEPLLPPLLSALASHGLDDRTSLLARLNRQHHGFYAPRFYEPLYDGEATFTGYKVEKGFPRRIKKVILQKTDTAAHSELLTPETEFAELYLTELGRGCSRGCRFCAAGFIYRPHRLWDREAILRGLDDRPDRTKRVGLLGMEMTDNETLEAIAGRISRDHCSLSFSSLRADRISAGVLSLLSQSGLKSVAIAPDGASERLRRVINKGLEAADLISAARRLVQAGLAKLKIYLMIGLPTETEEDLLEFLDLVEKIQSVIKPLGQQRGHLCELSISVNSFVPKPWTPFQYHPYGISAAMSGPGGEEAQFPGKLAVKNLRSKIALLKKGLSGMANTRVSFDNPDHVLFQAVLARGDRRLAAVLLNMAGSGISWKQAMKEQDLSEAWYATRLYSAASALPWTIVDHSIKQSYLWKEYCKSFAARITIPCDTVLCRRCGVCHD